MIRSLLATLLLCLPVYSQSLDPIQYQAVVYDAGGETQNNTTADMQISILQDSESGIDQYLETHSPATFGLVNLMIDDGDSGGSNTYEKGFSGELGGYVFWVSANGKHGLVAETQDQGSSTWYRAQDLISKPANHSADGKRFKDWRLPTRYELNEMYLQKAAIGGFDDEGYYWCSTDNGKLLAWNQEFSNDGFQWDWGVKSGNSYRVRAVRSF